VVGDPDDDVTRWVVGGHSLGGAMASQYAETERDELVGLLLHAAYPVRDMSDRTGLAVTSIFGAEDGITTPEDVEESTVELPASTQFVPIDGAIHSFFGDYGPQRGDGTATVSRTDAQAAITAATLAALTALD
jgi:pimeloyl-ACP methyl ester carboxylesterase